jgi:prepilin peptidase CpaA
MAAYSLLLILAALQDMKSLRISNWWVVAVFVVSLASTAAFVPWNQWWQHGVSFVAVFAVGLVLFWKGWFGGGDTKLMSAAALAFNLKGLLHYLPLVVFFGGLVVLMLMILRRMTPSAIQRRLNLASFKSKSVPYAVAIATGAIAAAASLA